MIKIVCSCGNEATRVKKNNDNEEPKFNIILIKRGEVVVGIGYECLGCGAVLDLVK